MPSVRSTGLSVTGYGDFEFGLPHRISCTVGVGHEGIIDLEREAELGGPIHTKAMMILKSYLTNLFARKKPLVLAGSLYFEQSYAGIEGDSASGAELVALALRPCRWCPCGSTWPSRARSAIPGRLWPWAA